MGWLKDSIAINIQHWTLCSLNKNGQNELLILFVGQSCTKLAATISNENKHVWSYIRACMWPFQQVCMLY